MAQKELKKILAGLGVAGLLTAGGITLPGAHASSGWGASKDNAGSVEKVVKPAGSGWSGSKESAVSTAKEEVDEKVKEAGTEAPDNVVDKAAEETKAAADAAVTKKPKKAAIEGC